MIKVKDSNGIVHELTDKEAAYAVQSGVYTYVDTPVGGVSSNTKNGMTMYGNRAIVYDKYGKEYIVSPIDAKDWVSTGSHSFTKPEVHNDVKEVKVETASYSEPTVETVQNVVKEEGHTPKYESVDVVMNEEKVEAESVPTRGRPKK